jgi:hypothetical protein
MCPGFLCGVSSEILFDVESLKLLIVPVRPGRPERFLL